MKIGLSDLWRWNGTIDRGPYVSIGIILALVKYNLDRIILGRYTGRPWLPWHYWMPGDVFGVFSTAPERSAAAIALLAAALPFVYMGVVLTLRRLRSMGWPPWLVVVFFLPFVNLLFFALLSILPARDEFSEARGPHFLQRFIPETRAGSALAAIGITSLLSGAVVLLGSVFLKTYGWGLFVGIPFVLGLLSTLIYNIHQPRSFSASLSVTALSLLILGGILFALAVEGIICIAMAFPLAFLIAMFGTFIGWAIASTRKAGHAPTVVVLLLPLLLGAEAVLGPEPELSPVRTDIVIHAPPEVVWKHVVSFSELPPPDEFIFRVGVAYPIRAEIQGRLRRCVFSTGAFVEPITVWDEPRLLKFDVVAQPRAMEETSPYGDIQPAHVEGYFVSHAGQFLLTQVEGGTRLEGTTWYTHRLWPEPYWKLWSDWIVHAIHRRVLRHIKSLAEADRGE